MLLEALFGPFLLSALCMSTSCPRDGVRCQQHLPFQSWIPATSSGRQICAAGPKWPGVGGWWQLPFPLRTLVVNSPGCSRARLLC